MFHQSLANHSNNESVNSSNFLPDGEHVQQSLRRMFSHTIAGIDDWTAAYCWRSLQSQIYNS